MSFGSSFAKAYAASSQRTEAEAETKAKAIASRKEAKATQQEMMLKMAEAGYQIGPQGGLQRTQIGSAQDEVLMQELQIQKIQNAAVRNKVALLDSDQALIDFTESGNANDLQKMLNNNDVLKQLWASRGIQQVAPIDWEHDKELMEKAGLPLFWADDPEGRAEAELDKYWFKVSDGQNWSLGSVASMTKETGVLRRVSSKKAQLIKDHLDSSKQKQNRGAFEQKVDYIFQNTPQSVRGEMSDQEVKHSIINGLMKSKDPVATAYSQNVAIRAKALGITPDEVIKQDEARKDKDKSDTTYKQNLEYRAKLAGRTPEEQYAHEQEQKNKPDVSPEVRDREQLTAYAMDTLGMDKPEAIKYAERQAGRTEYIPSDIKELEAAEQAQSKLVADFGGEDEFFNTDFSEPKNFRKAINSVERMEKLAGIKYDAAERKSLQDINSLLTLGPPSAKLTSKETGLIDSFMKGVREYVSDNVEGTGATSAYNTFRNSVRHALYGAALTDAEIKSFNQAFGTLGQQLGPVLTKLRTSIGQVRSKLNTIARLGNPYIAQVRIGTSQEHVDKIISALDSRLELIDKAGREAGSTDLTQYNWIK